MLPGELVEAERTGVRKQVQRARMVGVKEASNTRVQAPCPWFGRCGGCQYQHARYEAQLEYKREILVETLRRVARIDFDPQRIEIESGEPYGYRNRAQFHIERDRMDTGRWVRAGSCLSIDALSVRRRSTQPSRL